MREKPNIPEEYKDIAPYTDKEFKEKVEHLLQQPEFEPMLKYFMPHVDYAMFANQLLHIENQDVFQRQIMGGILEYLETTTSKGVSIDGIDNIKDGQNYTFITNHRDIVLDASFLNLALSRTDKPLTQVAIGNNLLIYDWITDLVKLNRSFIVKRDEKMLDALKAARQLSGYIHFCVNELKESVWIAQREGRAKDSNDLTQESLIKMLSLEGGGSVKDNILSVHLCPISISFEYDPNDFFKAVEFLHKRRDPQYKKRKNDDLFSMENGIRGQKGRIVFRVGKCINDALESFESDNRLEIIRQTCRLIDAEIHCGYEIFPGNYIAYDRINNTREFADKYTKEDEEKFNAYIESQLDRVRMPNITPDERDFMRDKMLNMYANPLKNKLGTQCVNNAPLQ